MASQHIISEYTEPPLSPRSNLIFGSPSLDNRDGFIQRGLVETGNWIGPRLFHTGNIIYGAGAVPWHQDINDLEEAKEALTRIKAEGGPASFSYKNYNIPSRYFCGLVLQSSISMTLLKGCKTATSDRCKKSFYGLRSGGCKITS